MPPSRDGASTAATPSLVWSTYLGGTGLDETRGVALDSEGNAYVVGLTYSPDFPLVSPGRTAARADRLSLDAASGDLVVALGADPVFAMPR